jgi:hypothetical protein
MRTPGGGGGGATSAAGAARSRWILFWQLFAVAIVLLTLVVVIISTVFVAQQDSVFRVCFEATPANIPPAAGVGETGAGHALGMVTIDQNADAISYTLQAPTLSVGGPMTEVTAVHVRGPISPTTGLAALGPLAASLCGAPSATPCDITTVPGTVAGTIDKVYDGAPPEATSVRPLMKDIRARPYLYYVEVLTNGKPVTPGSCRAPMTATCGFA